MKKGEPEIRKGEGEKRVGLFGGTFNPIHMGHLRGAEEIREIFGLQEVVFIPAATPPHKPVKGLMEANHRLEMVKLATRDNPFFSVSDVELRRTGKSYSIDTIEYFREHREASLYFILGGDAFLEIETWKEFQRLFSLCNFVIMMKPGTPRNGAGLPWTGNVKKDFRHHSKARSWIHRSGHLLYFQEILYLDISSTKVRERIEQETSVKYLVPAEVELYIKEHGLYRKKP